MNKKRLFILAPYPKGTAPSQRFRFEQYLTELEKHYTIEFHSFLSEKTWANLYKEGRYIQKAIGILGSFWRRIILLFHLKKADVIFIHREASMIGPPVFEWFIAHVLKKPFVYDFDDAIWLPNYSQNNAKFQRLKAYGKVRKIMKWATRISAGNQYLKEFASQYNNQVTIIPTTIDLQRVHTQQSNHDAEELIIGWTGTHTTLHYLSPIIPVLQELEKKYSFTFRVISNQPPDFDLDSLEYTPWNKTTEINDLSALHIGIMPLTETVWSNGKCGFKGLQYMALEIPALLSPVGVNQSIIQHGENGFLCDSLDDWKNALIQLIESSELRKQLGKKGRETVINHYSVRANTSHYLKLLEQ